MLHVGFGHVKTLTVRNKLISKLYQHFRVRVTPTAYRMLCLRFTCLVQLSFVSATGARLDTGGWLALTRRGLSPRKIRRAFPGAITLGVSRACQPQRRRSEGWQAGLGSCSRPALRLRLPAVRGVAHPRRRPAFRSPLPGGRLKRDVSAPSEAWRFLPGESPGRVRASHPPVSSVAPLAERCRWSRDCGTREQQGRSVHRESCRPEG